VTGTSRMQARGEISTWHRKCVCIGRERGRAEGKGEDRGGGIHGRAASAIGSSALHRLAIRSGDGRGTCRRRGLEAANVRHALEEAHRAHGRPDLVSEWELRRTLEAEALEVTGEEVLGVGRLQAHRAAGQSYLADEAILLDHTDRELVLTSREAALVLQADACAATIAENLNVLEVASRVAADASGVHEVGHGDGVLQWMTTATNSCVIMMEPMKTKTMK